MYTSLPGPALAATEAPPAWRIVDGQKAPDPPPDNLLFGVSCPISYSCVAVGYRGNSSLQETFVETLSGRTWRVTPQPHRESSLCRRFLERCLLQLPRHLHRSRLGDDCDGHQWSHVGRDPSQGRVERYPEPEHDGRVRQPFRRLVHFFESLRRRRRRRYPELAEDACGESEQTQLAGHAEPKRELSLRRQLPQRCLLRFSTHCVAVGFAADGSGMSSRTLIETLSGGTWRISPSLSTRSPINQLFGVRCTTPSSCVAVGEYGSLSSQRTLVKPLAMARGGLARAPTHRWQ